MSSGITDSKIQGRRWRKFWHHRSSCYNQSGLKVRYMMIEEFMQENTELGVLWGRKAIGRGRFEGKKKNFIFNAFGNGEPMQLHQ